MIPPIIRSMISVQALIKAPPAHRRGSAHPQAKLTDAEVRVIDAALKRGACPAAIARQLSTAGRTLTARAIYSIRDGRTWRHVTGRGA